MKENQKNIIIAILIFIIVILFILVILFAQKAKSNCNNVIENNEITNETPISLEGISCGVDCKEYDIDKTNTKYTINYNQENINISMNIFNSDDYEKSILNISVNNNKIYNTVSYTNKVKIFKFNDIFVAEYIETQSQCGNIIDVLIDKNGNIIKPSNDEMDDSIVMENNETIVPSIMKTEFNQETNSIVIYKEICGVCSGDDYQTGFKYTYSLENANLIFENKENIYCQE